MPGAAFIARRMKSGEGLATALVALSFFVVIIAFAVAGGFRREVQAGLRAVSGDILLAPAGFDYPGGGAPVVLDAGLAERLARIDGIREIRPFVSRGGIVRKDGDIHGVIVKGVADTALASLHARIPRRLSELMSFAPGERMTVWFVGDKVQARQFTIDGMYDAVASTDENLTLLVPLSDMQRLSGWGRDSISACELTSITTAFRPASDIFAKYSCTIQDSGVVFFAGICSPPQMISIVPIRPQGICASSRMSSSHTSSESMFSSST